MMNPNMLLSEGTKPVIGFAPAVPSAAAPQWANLAKYPRCTILISQSNAAAGATGSAVTLNQAKDVSGTSTKALAFTTARRNTDITVNDTLTDFAVASNTFTTDTTASKNSLYEITVRDTDLDNANAFKTVQVGLANATNSTISVLYILWPAKYGATNPASAITN